MPSCLKIQGTQKTREKYAEKENIEQAGPESETMYSMGYDDGWRSRENELKKPAHTKSIFRLVVHGCRLCLSVVFIYFGFFLSYSVGIIRQYFPKTGEVFYVWAIYRFSLCIKDTLNWITARVHSLISSTCFPKQVFIGKFSNEETTFEENRPCCLLALTRSNSPTLFTQSPRPKTIHPIIFDCGEAS